MIKDWYDSRSALYDYIDRLESEYNDANPLPAYNISNWDSTSSIGRELLKTIYESINPFGGSYLFSYQIPTSDKQNAQMKLAARKKNAGVLVTPSGTLANAAAICAAKMSGRTHGIVLHPSYFQPHLFSWVIGIKLRTISKNKISKILDIRNPSNTFVLINNPAYCTSEPWHPDQIEVLSEFMRLGGLLIADECNLCGDSAISRFVENHENLITTHSPYKTIGINSIKLGLVIYDKSKFPDMEKWSDVVAGPLPINTPGALKCFVSDEFDIAKKRFNEKLAEANTELTAFCENHNTRVKTGFGIYRSMYIKKLPAVHETNKIFIKQALRNTGVIHIPSSMAHADGFSGYSFRLNVSLKDDGFFWIRLHHLIKYLNSQAVGYCD